MTSKTTIEILKNDKPIISIDTTDLNKDTVRKILKSIDLACKVERLSNIEHRPYVSPSVKLMVDEWNKKLIGIETQCVQIIEKL